MESVKGRIHSIQSLGTVDGPGVRFVAFLSGCPLRCKCCHNPDTWDTRGGTEYTAKELVNKVLRFKEYFGAAGGITLSGGEPLCQSEFCEAVFALCKEQGINTCLDTSGFRLDGSAKRLLLQTDRVLLDIKYTSEALYRENVGMTLDSALEFLSYLNEKNIPTTLRQVVVPTINDTAENLERLRDIISSHGCIDSFELLPFRKICQTKYDSMSLEFPFSHIPEANADDVRKMEDALNKALRSE